MSEQPLSRPAADRGSAAPRPATRRDMTDWIDQLISRRSVLAGATTLSLAALAGTMLGGCGDGSGEAPDEPAQPIMPAFNFEVVPLNMDDRVTLPPGHSAQVLYAYGDPLTSDFEAYSNQGAEPASEWDYRAGDHHDGMRFFGLNDDGALDPNASNRGILCINHENITQFLMHETAEVARDAGGLRDADQVRKEMRAHGVSCIEVVRDPASGRFSVVRDSPYNRRITAYTPVELHGPVAGTGLAVTKYSPDGLEGRGTLNNCANGYTPWGTYLTCEENFHMYFEGGGVPGDTRYSNRYEWADLAGHAEETGDEFGRFDTAPTGASAMDDFRNEANHFGYVVEIDPLNPDAAPRKRTALGRFAHEGVWPARVKRGRPLVFYTGDDSRFQFIYKFVSDKAYGADYQDAPPLDTGDAYLDDGTLYAARFDADPMTGQQIGAWLPLRPDNPDLRAAGEDMQSPFYGLFGDLPSILVHTRAAAFAAGATPMDRPEWGAVNPGNGEVYFTLTNNTDRRGVDDADLAAGAPAAAELDEVMERLAGREFGETPSNPRGPNPHGHIIRFREDGDDPAATGFVWDIFVFGSGAGGATNFSALSADNAFTDCDGLWFDAAGLLWIQTDGGQPGGNHNQMLAAIPGEVEDGGVDAGNVDASLRRFLVGPTGCEITGIDMTPDRRSMFVNIQHPDERNSGGHWPHDGRDAAAVAATGRARSATIVITRDDGGPLGAA